MVRRSSGVMRTDWTRWTKDIRANPMARKISTETGHAHIMKAWSWYKVSRAMKMPTKMKNMGTTRYTGHVRDSTVLSSAKYNGGPG